MQLLIFIFIIGACHCAPSDFSDSNDNKYNSVGEASSLNSEVQPSKEAESVKYGCNIYDSILIENCTNEANMYLDASKKQCCQNIAIHDCKIRLLKDACSDDDYKIKINLIQTLTNIMWNDTPDCPKNYDQSFCDLNIGESILALPPSWLFTAALIFLVVIFLLAIIFGIKYC